MGAINLETHPQLHQQMAEGNLRRQFDLLRDMVSVGLAVPFKVNARMIDTVHVHALTHLVEKPGRYREHECHISGSNHMPPPPLHVKKLMLEFIVELHKRWDEDQTFILAAYAFWRFCWIHPYEDGNGRTARAICLLIICLKLRRWLPGNETLPLKIKKSRDAYTSALRHADESFATGNLDLSPLALLLSRHTVEQLSE